MVVVEPDAGQHAALLDRVAAAAVDGRGPRVRRRGQRAPARLVRHGGEHVRAVRGARPACDLAASLGRLLRPNGRLLFLEHVRTGGLRGTMQHVAGHVWQRMFDGCHPDRDTVGSIREAGFAVTDLERFSIRLAAPVVRPAVPRRGPAGGGMTRRAGPGRRRRVDRGLHVRPRAAGGERRRRGAGAADRGGLRASRARRSSRPSAWFGQLGGSAAGLMVLARPHAEDAATPTRCAAPSSSTSAVARRCTCARC